MYIYLVLNTLNGKGYVGQTRRKVQTRWREHVRCAIRSKEKRIRNNHFYRAINKYSPKNFEIRTILSLPCSKDLEKAEQYFIEYFKTNRKEYGYNGTSGGEGGARTQETRQKIRLGHLGKKRSEASIEKTRQGLRGKPRPTSVIEKMRLASSGKKQSEETKHRNRLSQLGRKHSEDTKNKMRKPKSPETKRKMKEAWERRKLENISFK